MKEGRYRVGDSVFNGYQSFSMYIYIQVWSLHGNNIVNLYSTNLNCDKIIDVLSFEIDIVYVHYDPLLREKYNDI